MKERWQQNELSLYHQWFCSPYVKGVSERIGRLLKQQSIQVSYKPQRTINRRFSSTETVPDETDRPSSGVEYRMSCSQCDFVYYGQIERSLKMRVSEHKKAVLMFDHNSKRMWMFTNVIITWILKTLKSLDMRHITISGFSRSLDVCKRPKRWEWPHSHPWSLQVHGAHLKFSRVTRIQHAQRFNFWKSFY